jgi:hypothetical protein
MTAPTTMRIPPAGQQNVLAVIQQLRDDMNSQLQAINHRITKFNCQITTV